MLLLVLVLIPFICGMLCWQSERIGVWIPRWVALFGTSIMFFITLLMWLCRFKYCQLVIDNFLVINHSAKWQLEYICSWIPRFGINLHLALDGLSLLMLMLSGIVSIIAVLSSWQETNHYQGLFYLNLLWTLGGVIGFFLAIDMFLLFFFWEIMLIPMYFLVSLWGSPEVSKKVRINTATKFFIYTQFSGLFMLISILALVSFNYQLNGFWSFDYEDLLNVVLPKHVEYLLMLGFFCAFAIKMPIVPLHGWLPETHSHSSNAGSIDLIGILLKTAVYGFFRFTLPLFPCAAKSFSPIAMFLGVLSIFYASWMAFIQTDIKRLIAYSNISHMGFILIGIYSNNQISYQGTVIQIISYSLSAAGMFILCGQLYERLNTRNIMLMGGLWNRINLMPIFSLCFIAAMLGMPGTGNFIGEITILVGNFHIAPVTTIIAAFGILFTSLYSLILMQRIYWGSAVMINKSLKDMTFREKSIVIILLLCLFAMGLFPQPILDTSYITMQDILIRLREHCYTHNII